MFSQKQVNADLSTASTTDSSSSATNQRDTVRKEAVPNSFASELSRSTGSSQVTSLDAKFSERLAQANRIAGIVEALSEKNNGDPSKWNKLNIELSKNPAGQPELKALLDKVGEEYSLEGIKEVFNNFSKTNALVPERAKAATEFAEKAEKLLAAAGNNPENIAAAKTELTKAEAVLDGKLGTSNQTTQQILEEKAERISKMIEAINTAGPGLSGNTKPWSELRELAMKEPHKYPEVIKLLEQVKKAFAESAEGPSLELVSEVLHSFRKENEGLVNAFKESKKLLEEAGNDPSKIANAKAALAQSLEAFK